jgi:insertion element IS1 protein InsB
MAPPGDSTRMIPQPAVIEHGTDPITFTPVRYEDDSWGGAHTQDAKSRQVIAFDVGDRSRRSAKRLWAKIPQAYRRQATFYTDQYVGYEGVIPAAQHKAISKLARKTNHIERFNNTLRQRVSRLVREALSFSKKLANHIGAIKLFICHYNLTRAVA